MNFYDFFIPEEYRGQDVVLPCGRPDWPKEPLTLSISAKVCYVEVNPLEEEEEYCGFQGESDRQQLNYYDKDGKYIFTQDLEHQIVTWRLISRLELLLKKQY